MLRFAVVILLILSIINAGFCRNTDKTRRKRETCQTKTAEGIYYKYGNIYGPDRYGYADTLEKCVEECLDRAACHFFNYVPSQKLCFLLYEGITGPNNIDPTKFDQRPDSIHGFVDCGLPVSMRPPTAVPVGSIGCGRQAFGRQPIFGRTRIVNGHEAAPHTWPWAVTHEVQLASGEIYNCGATLIRVNDKVEASDILVTAAHCVVEAKTMSTSPKGMPAENMRIIAGRHNRNQRALGEERRKVADYRFHPLFRMTETGIQHDIAVLKLERPIDFSDTIRPICLPAVGNPLPIGQQCVAAGWGRNNSLIESLLADNLMQLPMQAHSAADCTRGWGNGYHEDQMICAGPTDATAGTCQGDSGGMYACRAGIFDPWVLYGATSFGVAGTCLGVGQPGVFTRISTYVENFIWKSAMEMTAVVPPGEAMDIEY